MCQTEDQLKVANEQIVALKKKLKEVEKAVEEAEQEGYDVRMAETEENLRAQVTRVCRGYCLQVWNEVLNQAGVDASSIMRRVVKCLLSPSP